jgi:hypothetical protein
VDVARLTLHSDPTLHLLGAFGVELVTIWLAVLTVLRLAGVHPTVEARAGLGAAYAASVLVIPAPTLDVSYQFVFSVLAVGTVGLLPRFRFDGDGRVRPASGIGDLSPARGVRDDGEGLPVALEVPSVTTSVVTALLAVTLAWLGYGVAYLVVVS